MKKYLSLFLFVLIVTGCSVVKPKSEGQVLYEKYTEFYYPQSRSEEALSYLKQASDLGYQDAQYAYGKILISEGYDKQRHDEGMALLEKLKTQEYPEAKTLLNSEDATLKGSALSGDVQSGSKLCEKYIRRRESDNLTKLVCQQPADAGDALSMFNLGLLLINEDHNDKQGIEYLAKAGSTGMDNAYWVLWMRTKDKKWRDLGLKAENPGILYYYGKELIEKGDRYFDEGVKFIKKAAAKNHLLATEYIQENEVYISLHSRLKKHDPEALYKYGVYKIEQSEEYTDAGGLSYIKESSQKGYEKANKFLVDHRMEIEAYKALKSGTSSDQINIGVNFYEGSNGARQNLKLAEKLFHAASKNGNKMALRNLGVLYENNGDVKKAISYYELAGDAVSLNFAGVLMYENNYPFAQWRQVLENAARLGSNVAVRNLNSYSDFIARACGGPAGNCSVLVVPPKFYR